MSNGRQVARSPPRNFQTYCQVIISSFIITATTKLPCSLFGAGGWFVGYLLLPLPPPTSLCNRATTCYHYHHQPPAVVVLLLSCAMIAAVVCSAQPYSTTALLPLREPSDSIASSSSSGADLSPICSQSDPMFGRRLARESSRLRLGQRARLSSLPTLLYNNVWRKSNIFYVTYIFAGCVILELIYGSLTNFVWESANRGVSLSGT